MHGLPAAVLPLLLSGCRPQILPALTTVTRWFGSSAFRKAAVWWAHRGMVAQLVSPAQRGSLANAQPKIVGSSLQWQKHDCGSMNALPHERRCGRAGLAAGAGRNGCQAPSDPTTASPVLHACQAVHALHGRCHCTTEHALAGGVSIKWLGSGAFCAGRLRRRQGSGIG